MKILMLLAALALLAGCGGGGGGSETAAPTPTLEQVKNLAYTGIGDEPVKLTDGAWEGEPFTEGSALRPAVRLVRDFIRTGDLDGERGDEAVVLLASNSGGTGEYIHLAVVGYREGVPSCLATTLLGDRVQVMSVRILQGETKRIWMEVVKPGPDDALCCPGDVVIYGWTYGRTGLKPIPTTVAPHRLSLDDLADREWVLRFWSWNEPALAEPEVTLNYSDGRFTGNNGCNNYFAGVEEGDAPGDFTVGPGGATKMFCPDPAGEIEMRFGRTLESAHKFGFLAGQLALSYEVDGEFGVMIFEGRERKETE
jgi:heat shock protein HslJ